MLSPADYLFMATTDQTISFPALQPMQPVKVGNSNWIQFMSPDDDNILRGLPALHVVQQANVELQLYDQLNKK